MLPKKIRLTTALFDQVFKSGRVQHSTNFWLRYLSPDGSISRFAVVVPKKVAKTAVLRNRIKRRVYGALEQNIANFSSQNGLMMIFGVKKDICCLSFDELSRELRDLQLKSGLK